MKNVLIIAIAVLIIIAILYFVTFTSTVPNIAGIWQAPEAFCANSGSQAIYMYVAPWKGQKSSITTPFYIIIDGQDSVIENTCCDATLSNAKRRDKNITVIDATLSETPRYLPQKISIHYNRDNQTCTILGDDTVYAALYKNNEFSALSKNKFEESENENIKNKFEENENENENEENENENEENEGDDFDPI